VTTTGRCRRRTEIGQLSGPQDGGHMAGGQEALDTRVLRMELAWGWGARRRPSRGWSSPNQVGRLAGPGWGWGWPAPPATIASMAGVTRTWATSKVRLVSPRPRAWWASRAVAGAVVSKPTARNTTWRWGSAWARARACRGR
jgi:hypothetical protein